jgi:hypothetical protein
VPAQPISRRVLIGAATAVLLSGCDDEPPKPSATATPAETDTATGATTDPDGTGSAQPSVSPADARLVARAVTRARGLVADYAGLVAAHPDVRRAVSPLRGHLVEHLTALGEKAGSEAARSPRSRQRALRALLATERTALQERLADARTADSGDLARVLASIAASHAQHALLLDRLDS